MHEHEKMKRLTPVAPESLGTASRRTAPNTGPSVNERHESAIIKRRSCIKTRKELWRRHAIAVFM